MWLGFVSLTATFNSMRRERGSITSLAPRRAELRHGLLEVLQPAVHVPVLEEPDAVFGELDRVRDL